MTGKTQDGGKWARTLAGLVLAAATVLTALGCPPKPKPPLAIVPHQTATGDSYCSYTVTKAVGGGIPVGGTICILCPVPNPAVCPTVAQVTPAEGVVYDLAPPAAGQGCAACPSTNTYK
jgi:hypothetical protein